MAPQHLEVDPIWRRFSIGIEENPPTMQESPVRSLGWEDPLEKGKATHSSILAWRILGVTKSRTRLSDFHFLRFFSPLAGSTEAKRSHMIPPWQPGGGGTSNVPA